MVSVHHREVSFNEIKDKIEVQFCSFQVVTHSQNKNQQSNEQKYIKEAFLVRGFLFMTAVSTPIH